MLLNPGALMIVCGGTLAALFIGFPLQRLRSALADVAASFRTERSRGDLARDIVEIARIYRKADIKALENRLKTMEDRFLRLGGELLISHRQNEDIRYIMERELSLRVMDFSFSQNLLKTAARLTPSFGLAGTVISLIGMFRDVHTPEAMAPLMAVAMMSTFYGVVLSNLVMLPLCAKLKDHAVSTEVLMHMTIEGVEGINSMEHPLRIEERIQGCQGADVMSPSGDRSELAVARSEGRA
jgi:chemotaxis protein MotA